MKAAKHIVRVEALEGRVLMDGNVNVAFIGDDMVVSGDKMDNLVKISRPGAGKVRVAGLEGTKINGGSFKDFSAAFDDLKIQMRSGGEDQVAVGGPISFTGDLSAELGKGEMVIEGSAGRVQIGGNLHVLGGARCDVAVRNEVVVNGLASISTGGSATAAANLGILPDFKSAKFSDPLDIDNPYFPLVPGTKYVYEEESVDDETGETVVETIIVEVTNQTKTILGVKNRVVRDRVFLNGLLIEDTFDWHCQDDNGNVWYFGEDTKDFEYDDEGNLIGTSTAGAWKAGVNGAKPGVIMMARPRVGDRYYQEFSPGNVLDQGAVVATNKTVTVPVGTFKNVVRTEDTTVMEPEGLDHKFYAPGLGLIKENKYDLQTGEIVAVVKLLSAKLNGTAVKQVVSPTGFTGINATGKGTGPVRVHGETTVRAGGAVILRQSRFSDEVDIVSKSDVTLVDSLFEDFSVQATDAVGLRSVTATEEVLIRGDVDVYIFGSTFNSDVQILLGGGDNELVIGKSSFHDLDADGGGGENTFDNRGGNRFDELDLRRFDD